MNIIQHLTYLDKRCTTYTTQLNKPYTTLQLYKLYTTFTNTLHNYTKLRETIKRVLQYFQTLQNCYNAFTTTTTIQYSTILQHSTQFYTHIQTLQNSTQLPKLYKFDNILQRITNTKTTTLYTTLQNSTTFYTTLQKQTSQTFYEPLQNSTQLSCLQYSINLYNTLTT